MECGDLVVVEVGRDERLRGIEIGQLLDAIKANLVAREVLAVRREVLADGRHRQRIGAEQLEVVGDVAGAAAELAAHARHQERHVQHVHLVGQDVVLELVLEHHDGVVGQRAADQCRHRSFRMKGWPSGRTARDCRRFACGQARENLGKCRKCVSALAFLTVSSLPDGCSPTRLARFFSTPLIRARASDVQRFTRTVLQRSLDRSWHCQHPDLRSPGRASC